MATKQASTKLGPVDFVHLHNHTQYSLLDGLTKIPALVEHVKESGMQAIAVTDHGTMSGLIEFYKEARAADIKPILGMETYVAARGHKDKEPGKDKQNYHLTILAMNETGYQNLMRLSTIANLDGFYYRPRIDHELLEKYNEGLIILSGCIGGEVGDLLRQNQYDQAKEIAEWYKKVFGDRYYIEIQDHGHPEHPGVWQEQVGVNQQAFKLAEEVGLQCVITCDAHYLSHDDQEAHEILLCVQTGSYLTDEKRMTLKDFELHVTDPQEVIERWGKDHPEAISNTKAIADRCSVTIELGKILIPKFPVPKGQTERSHLERLVYQGLAWRYGDKSEKQADKLTVAEIKKILPKHVAERAVFELEVIEKMGFNGYFLIISDFINAAKDKGIVFGPGRGSAAGSIISFALKITEIDPLKYDLLFERFLNPDRISMPDIDIDIQDSRRNEVIEYCVEKYGTERVANIVTFGRMAARNAVRDVARVLQVPYADADRLAKMIPQPIQGRHILLSKSLKDNAELKLEYETNDQSKRVFDLAVQMEGTIRSHGVHAAGVVIAPDDIVKFAPLEMAQKGVVATQYSMNPIEELGLLKMDFLGLSNLTIIKNALRIIKRVYGKDIDINKIPLDDAATYKLFQKGDTTGVFQVESAGMKRYLKELKPNTFEDIIAMVALYRPGPMQFIDEFIARKNGHRKINYIHPKMEAALANTYGILVYQEQVMQISKDLCGFTGGQADTLRKGIGKKIPAVLAKMKKEFIEGAISYSDMDRGAAEKFWKQLEDFAAYCFNKSHAACYGLISYWTAYLKANHPAAFMAALMTSDYDDTDRLAIEINECQHMGIDVLPPDVNESFVEFAVVAKPSGRKPQIRFGMSAVKNVGTSAVEEVLRARDIDGQFANLEDFLGKVNNRVVNRKTLESLIKAGAFDRFGDRNILLGNVDNLVAYASRLHKQADSGQTDLFGEDSSDIATAMPKLALDPEVTKFPLGEQLQWERELLGLYLSQHPLDSYTTFLSEHSMPLSEFNSGHDSKAVTVGGIISEMREITTKNGQKMAFIKIADVNGEIELILFPNAYQQTTGIWERDRVVLVRGKLSAKDREGNISNELKVMVDDAREVTLEQATAYQATGRVKKTPKARPKAIPMAKEASVAQASMPGMERLYIRLENSDDQNLLVSLKETIDSHQGQTEVVLVLGSAANKQIVKLPTRVNREGGVLDKLHALVGEPNVVIR
jgi:DNA polymerase-3 subunit alpha